MQARRHGQKGRQTERRHRCGLALEHERLDRLRLDRVAHERQGGLADQDLARLCRLLEARSNVDRDAGGKALLGAGHHFARGEADAGLRANLGQRVPHLDRGAAGT